MVKKKLVVWWFDLTNKILICSFLFLSFQKQTMKSLTLISFTTFFILLVITSSLADEKDDKKDNKDENKDKKVELVKE